MESSRGWNNTKERFPFINIKKLEAREESDGFGDNGDGIVNWENSEAEENKSCTYGLSVKHEKGSPQKPKLVCQSDNLLSFYLSNPNDSEGSYGNTSEALCENESESLVNQMRSLRHSLSHLIKDCDYYEKKMAREAEVKRVVNTGNGVAKPVWLSANWPKVNAVSLEIIRLDLDNQYLNKTLKQYGGTSTEEHVDFLRGSNLRYALTTNPTIYDFLCSKQFWQTATANTKADGSLEINATINTIGYTITEASIRDSLQLEDATGITMLPNDELFEGMGQMSGSSVISRFDSRETDLQNNKLTMGNALVGVRKKYFAEEEVLELKGIRPMTQSQLKSYMMEFYLEKSGDMEVIQLRNLILKSQEEFAKLVITEDRKQMARRGLHTNIDKDDSEGSDEVSEQDDSVIGTKIPINPVPVAMKTPSIATYIDIKQDMEEGPEDELEGRALKNSCCKDKKRRLEVLQIKNNLKNSIYNILRKLKVFKVKIKNVLKELEVHK
ncbi:hypothetical protein Tco_0707264 [Tanacetum coccineum]|uniref:Uncharacterized protein n=1 Tax=Tanacetum coccineum TaxID=301880 RepID=A0ABQ4YBB4_9ASTR